MLPHWPQDLWCHSWGRRDPLVPAVKRLRRRQRLVFVLDAVDDDLAILLQLPHDIAHVLDAVLVDLSIERLLMTSARPSCRRGARILGAQRLLNRATPDPCPVKRSPLLLVALVTFICLPLSSTVLPRSRILLSSRIDPGCRFLFGDLQPTGPGSGPEFAHTANILPDLIVVVLVLEVFQIVFPGLRASRP